MCALCGVLMEGPHWTEAGTDAGQHGEGYTHLPAEHVAHLGDLADQLVHCTQREVGDAHLDHRPRAAQRGAEQPDCCRLPTSGGEAAARAAGR